MFFKLLIKKLNSSKKDRFYAPFRSKNSINVVQLFPLLYRTSQVDQGQTMRPHCLPTLAGPELPLFIPSQVMRSNEDKSAILHGCVGV